MKPFGLTLTLILGFLAEAVGLNYRPGQLYVTFKPGRVTLTTDSTGFRRCGITYLDSVNLANNCLNFRRAGCAACDVMVNDYLVIFPESSNVFSLTNAYMADTNVRWVGPNYLVELSYTPNDAFFLKPPGGQSYSYQWPLDSNHLQMEKAWDITRGDSNVVVAILEGGAAWRHPDLMPNVWINSGEDLNHNGKFDTAQAPAGDINHSDNDSDGFADNVIGYHFCLDGEDPDPEPDANCTLGDVNFEYFIHGAWVWSNVGAKTDNDTGVAGVAFNCRVMPVGWGIGDIEDLNSALNFVLWMRRVHNVPAVVNMSFISEPDDITNDLLDSLYNRGVVLVAAAHNDNFDVLEYPASHPKVLAVAGTAYNDVKYPSSNYNIGIDLSAPANNYQATHSFIQNKPVNYRYDYFGGLSGAGTSISTPQVAGVAALLKSAYPNMTPAEVNAKLRSSTDPIYHLAGNDSTTLWYQKLGTGRLNAFKAVTFFGNIPNAANDTTLRNTVYVSGDIRVRAGKTLRVAAGTVFKYYPGDVMKGGLDINKAEIIVDSGGTLRVEGQQGNPVQFVSFKTTPGQQDWHGVVVKKGGSAKIYYAHFKHAYAALEFQNSANDTVEGCLFQNNFMYGIYTKNGNLRIIRDSLRDNSMAVYMDSASAVVESCYFKDNSIGIYTLRSFGRISHNTIIGSCYLSDVGLQAEGYVAGATQFLRFNNNMVSGQFMQAGVMANARVRIDSCNITTGKQVCPPVPDDVPLNRALQAFGTDSTVVRFSYLRVGGSYGSIPSLIPPVVEIDVFTPVNLGLVGRADSGYNSILRNGTLGKAVKNYGTAADTAQNNWWGTADSAAIAARITGPLVFHPFLTSQPSLPQAPRVDAREEKESVPLRFSLSQNYPNPFNPTTTIQFSLPAADKVTLKLYNLLGQEVRTLLDGDKPVGTHQIVWDGRDENGITVASGIYFYKLETASFREVKRMIFLK